jgi:hypothetical protein
MCLFLYHLNSIAEIVFIRLGGDYADDTVAR